MKNIKSIITNIWKSINNIDTSIDKNKITLNRPIKNTPFTLQGNEDHGYFLCIGRYRITEPCNDPETAIEKLAEEPWQIISRMIASYIEFDKTIPTEIREHLRSEEDKILKETKQN